MQWLQSSAAANIGANKRLKSTKCRAAASVVKFRLSAAQHWSPEPNDSRVRFFIDSQTDAPHVYGHRVSEDEVDEILINPAEDRPGKESSRVALGRTRSGRFLRVIYVPDPEPNSVFVITAYELKGKPLTAFRRRHRRKSK